MQGVEAVALFSQAGEVDILIRIAREFDVQHDRRCGRARSSSTVETGAAEDGAGEETAARGDWCSLAAIGGFGGVRGGGDGGAGVGGGFF